MKAIEVRFAKELDKSFVVFRETGKYFPCPWHYHPEYEFVLVNKSSGRRMVGDHIGYFNEGDLVFMGPHLPHVWRNDEAYFQKHIASLDTILPGTGSVQDRFQTLANRFIIPKEKLDTVFQAAIAECRLRTKKYYQLPSEESFKLEFVTDKSWNGYNWYKGNYTSLIQINTDLSIFLDRAIDVGSHESYPGHHVYNMLLEKNLYADQGLIEISLYPLYSPTSLIA